MAATGTPGAAASLPVCRVLVADSDKAMKDLQGALEATNLELLRAHTFDEALELTRSMKPDACIVGYHFDEARPYRLIQQLRSELGESVPILLIRALPPVGLDRTEEEIKDSYRSLGANEYVPLYDYARSKGWSAAWAHLAQQVGRSLRGANCRQ